MQQTNTPNITETRQDPNWQALQQYEAAKQFQRAGDHESARAALSRFWTVVGERPDVAALEPTTQAQILLAVGALAGRIGSTRQISGSQEFAKDLLSESRRLFRDLQRPEQAAEAQNELAICYWREGAFEESRLLFREALAEAESSATRLQIYVDSTSVEISTGHYQAALALLRAGGELLDSIADAAAQGQYHLQLALVHKKLGDLDAALIEYSAASFHLEQAGHTRYLGRVENNTGMILLELRRYSEALTHLDNARRIFVSLKDSGIVAQVNESRAQVLIAQNRFHEAERAASSAVAVQQQGGEQSLLAESLMTHGVALARLGRDQAARSSFQQAVAVTDSSGDLRSAGRAYLLMIEELAQFLSSGEAAQLFIESDQRLQNPLDEDTAGRLRRCARIVIERVSRPDLTVDDLLIGGSLEEEVLHLEGELILRALDQEKGSITRAAHRLGLSHQGLKYILETRQKSLMSARTPVRKRFRSIIKK
jgi:tetratricopeptide (TPR) repeat protein